MKTAEQKIKQREELLVKAKQLLESFDRKKLKRFIKRNEAQHEATINR